MTEHSNKDFQIEVGYLPNNGWCIFIPNEKGTAKEIIEHGFDSPKEAQDKLDSIKNNK